MRDDTASFLLQRKKTINKMNSDILLKRESDEYLKKLTDFDYSYNFDWMGIPIIQFPQDIVALQEIIWKTKPEMIIETGVARGGAMIFYSSMLKMMEIDGEVVGIDIDIRKHNRENIENHPLSDKIVLIEGSSTDKHIVEKVYKLAKEKERILVILDSLHTHDHVLEEIKLYSPLVKKGNYLVVLDTLIEDMPKGYYKGKPWDKGNNPKTAVLEFLKENDRFEIDKSIHSKLQITVGKDGYLRSVK